VSAESLEEEDELRFGPHTLSRLFLQRDQLLDSATDVPRDNTLEVSIEHSRSLRTP